MAEFPIPIETDYCAHCHEAIKRVPYETNANTTVSKWVWRWVHHNSGSDGCAREGPAGSRKHHGAGVIILRVALVFPGALIAALLLVGGVRQLLDRRTMRVSVWVNRG